MKRVLDLYSGLGGFSEAFYQDPTWEVIRIDNNPLLSDVPNTIIADLTKLDPRDYRDIDLILASPPCTDFSNGYSSPRAKAHRAGIDQYQYKPDMTLVKTAIRWVNIIKPKFYLLENVVGSIRYFREERLYPISMHKPFVFYGNFPQFDMPNGWKHKKPDTWSDNPLRANVKAKLPLDLSLRILETFEGTTTLGRWIECE